jgi:hypothetical protein
MSNHARPHAESEVAVVARLTSGDPGAAKNSSRKNPCNPLKNLDSDERIQGNPRESNASERGLSQRNGNAPRKPKSTA